MASGKINTEGGKIQIYNGKVDICEECCDGGEPPIIYKLTPCSLSTPCYDNCDEYIVGLQVAFYDLSDRDCYCGSGEEDCPEFGGGQCGYAIPARYGTCWCSGIDNKSSSINGTHYLIAFSVTESIGSRVIMKEYLLFLDILLQSDGV